VTFAAKGGPPQRLPSSTPDPEEPGCHLMKVSAELAQPPVGMREENITPWKGDSRGWGVPQCTHGL
jgi:hypothetical protein